MRSYLFALCICSLVFIGCAFDDGTEGPPPSADTYQPPSSDGGSGYTPPPSDGGSGYTPPPSGDTIAWFWDRDLDGDPATIGGTCHNRGTGWHSPEIWQSDPANPLFRPCRHDNEATDVYPSEVEWCFSDGNFRTHRRCNGDESWIIPLSASGGSPPSSGGSSSVSPEMIWGWDAPGANGEVGTCDEYGPDFDSPPVFHFDPEHPLVPCCETDSGLKRCPKQVGWCLSDADYPEHRDCHGETSFKTPRCD